MHLNLRLMKAVAAASLLVALGAAAGFAANKFGKPKSVLHVVTLYYKDGTTEEQKKPRPFTDAFVIEFEDQAAFDKYTNHPAHKAFEELYIPLRGHSGTHDITN